MVVESKEIWKIVDSWKNTPGSDIQKFHMILDAFNKLTTVQINFNTPTRDPLRDL